MHPRLLDHLAHEIDLAKEKGPYKDERVNTSAQQAAITVGSGASVVNFCANNYLGTQDTLLYSSCFDANGGLFKALLDPNDAVISAALNHASTIDGIR